MNYEVALNSSRVWIDFLAELTITSIEPASVSLAKAPELPWSFWAHSTDCPRKMMRTNRCRAAQVRL